MSRTRTLGQALKDAAIKFAREAERFVGADDATECLACSHPRSEHCGCGAHCFGMNPAGILNCVCTGFAPKKSL